MATDKKKTGYTLADKCKDEADKLRKELAEDLRKDMKRLFTDRILSDLLIKAGNREFHVHKIVFEEMGCDIYREMMALPGSSVEEGVIVLDSVSNPEDLKEILSSFYTDDDISHPVKKLRKYIEMSLSHNDMHDSAERSATANNLNINDNSVEMKHVLSDLPNNMTNIDDHIRSRLEAKVGDFVKQIIKNAQKIVVAQQSCNVVTENGDADDVIRLVDSFDAVDDDQRVDHTTNANASHILCRKNAISNTGIVQDTSHDTEHSDFTMLNASEKEVSRIPRDEVPTSELVKKELNLVTAPRTCSLLGEDLLRKLVRGTASDCVVSVGDWEFPAHRCMLAARSSYFAMMLNGSWMESDQEKIMLEGVDANVVKQMLLYIYGGVLDLDPACCIGGLVMAADMYDIVGMKSIISLTLNKDYCHFFHKPCQGCIAGVPETLPLTMMYNMENMCEKCLRWINKHKEKVWPTKTFALLPQECLDYCSAGAVKDLNIINIIDCLLECQRLNEKIPRLKWSDSVLNCVATLMDAALEYASQNFVNIISGQEFKHLDGKSLGFNLRPLEEIFSLVMTSLTPGVACQSYLALHTLYTHIENYNKAQEESRPSGSRFEETYRRFSEEYTSLVEKLCKKCKEQLCLYIHQAVNTSEWFLLSNDMQKELMDEANYVCIDSPGRGKMAARPKLTSMKKLLCLPTIWVPLLLGPVIQSKKPLSSEMRVSMKEYFDRHFGPKETFPAGAIAKTKEKSKVPQKVPKKTGARDSQVTKKERSVGQGDGQKEGLSGQKIRSSKQEVTKTGSEVKSSLKEKPKSSSSQFPKKTIQDKKSTNSTSDMKSTKSKTEDKDTPLKSSKVTSKTHEKSASSTKLVKSTPEKQESSIQKQNYSLFANIRKEAATGSNEIPHQADQSNTCVSASQEQENSAAVGRESVPRQRSQSTSSAAFVPHFGITPRMQSAQSVDSFFGNKRSGQTTVVPKPLPTFNVTFVVPHEFYEQF